MTKFDPLVLRTGTVLKPSAQTTTQCAVNTKVDLGYESIENVLSRVPVSYSSIRLIVELQYRYGLRVTEVLSISIYDVSKDGRIVIKGLKSSSDRVVYVFNNIEYLNRCKQLHVEPFMGIDRYHVYRVYKKIGFIYKSVNSSKMSVTHSFRHRVVENMRNDGVDEGVMAQFIGHKNVSNTGKYGSST